MLATQNDPIKTSLNTNVTSRGRTRQRITPINITFHTWSVLGRTYWQLLTNPDITQLNVTTTPLRYNQAKGLIGRPNEKIAWATMITANPDILKAFKEGLQETKEEQQQTNKKLHPSKATGKKANTPNQGQRENAPHGKAHPIPHQADETETSSGGQATNCSTKTEKRRP